MMVSVGYRLRAFLKGVFRLVLIGLALAALFVGWRAVLHYGPGASQGLFWFHAKALVRERASFPRPSAEILLPTPRTLSSADVQLRLMKWREGNRWMPEALARGEEAKNGLRLRAGVLSLVELTQVGAAEVKDGQTTCVVKCRVRWDLPEDLQELLRVKEIVELRLPKGLGPGQTGEIACTFRRDGWRWELVSITSPWGGDLDLKAQPKGWFDWLF